MSEQNDPSRLRESVCAGKIGYSSQGEARLSAKQASRHHGALGRLIVYRCSFCSRFHVGHKRRKKNPGQWRNPSGAPSRV